jgi:hypothetical protein
VWVRKPTYRFVSRDLSAPVQVAQRDFRSQCSVAAARSARQPISARTSGLVNGIARNSHDTRQRIACRKRRTIAGETSRLRETQSGRAPLDCRPNPRALALEVRLGSYLTRPRVQDHRQNTERIGLSRSTVMAPGAENNQCSAVWRVLNCRVDTETPAVGRRI